MKNRKRLLLIALMTAVTVSAFAQTEPKTAEEYLNRGKAYYEKKEYDKAIADFEAALRINPNLTSAKEMIERIKKERGN